MHALIGPNGAGKSTCLNVLTGVYRAAAGRVRYGDVELTRLRPHQIAALGVCRTFQNLALSASATVAREPAARPAPTHARRLSRRRACAPRVRGGSSRPRSGAWQRSPTCSSSAACSHRPVAALPYGVRKRVELARALCAEPSLLLLDEPVAGMTADESARLAATLARVRAELVSPSCWSSTTWRSSWGSPTR